jgi:hypothetical protein
VLPAQPGGLSGGLIAGHATRLRPVAAHRHPREATTSRVAGAQQRILAAVAENTAPLHGREVRARHNLPKTGANAKAVAALVEAGEIVTAPGTATGHRVVDPLFAVWLRGGRAWPYGD